MRTQVDQSGDRISKCIRNGEIEKIPLLAIIGAKELEQGGLVSVRSRTGGDLGPMNVDTLLSKMMLAIQEACDLQDVV